MKRIATVGYVNAKPLTARIDRDRYEVVEDVPSAIARQLTEREVDVALVPVATVLGNPELRIVPGQAIGADGEVTSVLIVAETPPEEWTELCLDGESRTSAMLTRTLLTGPFGERAGIVCIAIRADHVFPDLTNGYAVDLDASFHATLRTAFILPFPEVGREVCGPWRMFHGVSPCAVSRCSAGFQTSRGPPFSGRARMRAA